MSGEVSSSKTPEEWAAMFAEKPDQELEDKITRYKAPKAGMPLSDGGRKYAEMIAGAEGELKRRRSELWLGRVCDLLLLRLCPAPERL